MALKWLEITSIESIFLKLEIECLEFLKMSLKKDLKWLENLT